MTLQKGMNGNTFLEIMEVNAGNCPSKGKQPSEHSKSANKCKRATEKEMKTSVFVNRGMYV